MIDENEWSSIVIATIHQGLKQRQLKEKHVRKQAISMASSELCVDPALQQVLRKADEKLELFRVRVKSAIDGIEVATDKGLDCIAAAASACQYKELTASKKIAVCCIRHERTECYETIFYGNTPTQDNKTYVFGCDLLSLIQAVMVVGNTREWLMQRIDPKMQTITAESIQSFKEKGETYREVINAAIVQLPSFV